MSIIMQELPHKELEGNTDVDPGVTVVTCFVEFEEKFLVLQRARNDYQHGMWGIPGGKLDKKEPPRMGLAREIFEETELEIPEDAFSYLAKALSTNPYDGSYLLYLYYVELFEKPSILINLEEHSAFDWVSIEDFTSLNLLVSQGKAFNIVKDRLSDLLQNKRVNMH